MKLNLTQEKAAILMFSVVHSPIDGLRWSDFGKLEAMKGMFKMAPGDEPKDVEVPADSTVLLRKAFNEAPAGRMPRYDGLAAAIAELESALGG